MNDENARTREAMNVAARDTDETDNTGDNDSENERESGASDTPPATAPLNPNGHDLTVYIAASRRQGHYCYQMVDTLTGLTRNSVHVQPEANETGLALLAAHDSLKSIVKKRITELIKARYGYATLGAALASRMRLRVQLVFPDSDLALLGGLATAPAYVGILRSVRLATEADRHLWQMVTRQARRFDVTWSAIAAQDFRLTEIEQWAGKVLDRAALAGPIPDHSIRETVLSPLLVRLLRDARAIRFPREVADRLVMQRLATPIGAPASCLT